MGEFRKLFSKYKRNSTVISVKCMLNYWKMMVAWKLYPKCYNCRIKVLMNKLVGYLLVKVTYDGIIHI